MKNMLAIVCAVALLAVALPVGATTVVLDFEGLSDNEVIGDYYNGGAGPDYGIGFSPNALAIIDGDAGGSGNFGGEPSPDTVLYFLTGPAATMNVAAGFDTGFSFYYSAVNQSGSIVVYDGLNATGNVLANLYLPITPSDGGDPSGSFSPFYPIGVAFSGIAMSVDFGGTVNQIGFDNITLGSDSPEVIPEPLTMIAVFTGVAGLARYVRKRRIA